MTTTRPSFASRRQPLGKGHHAGHFDFQPLSAHEWRVVDSNYPSDSVEALVGFVARHNGAFYATRLKHPLESVPFASLDAVAAFVGRYPHR